jgi:hypothetical protein
MLVLLALIAYFFVRTYLAGEHIRLALISGSFVAGIILLVLAYLLLRGFVARTVGWANGENPDPPTDAPE